MLKTWSLNFVLTVVDPVPPHQLNEPDTGSELGASGKSTVGFDFAVAEECQTEESDNCDSYSDVYGNNMLEIEYTNNGRSVWLAACEARGSVISVIYRDLDVVPFGSKGYHYEEC